VQSTMALKFWLLITVVCAYPSNGFAVKSIASHQPHLTNKRASPAMPTSTSSSRLWLENNEGNNDESQEIERPAGLPLGAIGLTLAFVAFWPLLALVRTMNYDQTIGFDIDSYMALKEMLEVSDVPSMDEIKELPPLSPAEKMVGALFGPPSR